MSLLRSLALNNRGGKLKYVNLIFTLYSYYSPKSLLLRCLIIIIISMRALEEYMVIHDKVRDVGNSLMSETVLTLSENLKGLKMVEFFGAGAEQGDEFGLWFKIVSK